MVIKRGEIWWASLPEPKGYEPGYRRPVLVIQANEFNKSRISTVIAVIITSNTSLAKAPGNVYLPAKISGLPKESVINISQIITVDRRFLSNKIKSLPQEYMVEIESSLRLVLSL